MPVRHLVAFTGQFRDEPFPILVKNIQYAYRCALLNHSLNRSLAYSNGSSCDCCYLACQSRHVVHSLSSLLYQCLCCCHSGLYSASIDWPCSHWISSAITRASLSVPSNPKPRPPVERRIT